MGGATRQGVGSEKPKERAGGGGTEVGLPPDGQRQTSSSLLCLCWGLSLSAGPVGFLLLISASFPLTLCDLHTNT